LHTWNQQLMHHPTYTAWCRQGASV
jgi:hypothetical protein